MTPLQRGLWLHGKLNRKTLQRVVTWTAVLTGPVDVEALTAALINVAARHPLLRATVRATGQGPVFRIGDVPGDVRFCAPSGATMTARKKSALQLLRQRWSAVDPGRGPIFVATVVPISPLCCALGIVVHHVVCDARSLGIILDELARDYADRVAGRPSRSELAVPAVAKPWRQDSLDFWAQQLDRAEPLALPQASAAPDSGPGRLRVTLSAENMHAVRATAANCRATTATVLITVLGLALRRYSAAPDIVVGSAIDVRSPLQAAEVGYHVNMLPLRLRWEETPDTTFADVVERVRNDIFLTLMHRDVPLSQILTRLRMNSSGAADKGEERNTRVSAADRPRRSPLYDVLFNYLGRSVHELRLPGINCQVSGRVGGVADYGLMVTVHDDPDEIEIIFEPRSSTFDTVTIREFARRHTSILHAVSAAPRKPLVALRHDVTSAT
jgi:hypothetical protein